ncbi:MAG: glycine cleavage system aminomethyltransferase GcvT [bacterium]
MKTPFYNRHEALGAKMVTFHGWSMPLVYSGMVDEHNAVRNKAGLFDASHMGEFIVEGDQALEFVQKLITNDALKLKDNQVLYTPMCNQAGGIVDDVLVHRFFNERFMLIVNASNTEKDFNWVVENARGMKVNIENISPQTVLLALQGPMSKIILQDLTKQDISKIDYYWFGEFDVAGFKAVVSRTGYTGELGYEILITGVAEDKVIGLWDILIDKGKKYGLMPCGLGSRDILRLEMKYTLYGNDINEKTNPLEAGLEWTVKFSKGPFSGSDALLKVKKEGVKRRLVGFIMRERAIARHGYEIFMGEEKIGLVTSGSFSPSLGKSIGMGYIKADYSSAGTEFDVQIRGKRYKAKVTDTPFYKKGKGKGEDKT